MTYERLVQRIRGSAHELHHRPFPDPLAGHVWVLEVERPAVVLGSTQKLSKLAIDRAERSGFEVATRRSGGGAVLLGPGSGLWVDVFVDPGDPLFATDIGVAAHRVGRCWADALVDLGHGAEVWTAAMMSGQWGRDACFAGVGPGEVMVGTDDPGSGESTTKAVGISQRRTRAGARVQCHVLFRSDLVRQAALADLVDIDPQQIEPLRSHLERIAGGIDADPADVLTHFLEHLGRA